MKIRSTLVAALTALLLCGAPADASALPSGSAVPSGVAAAGRSSTKKKPKQNNVKTKQNSFKFPDFAFPKTVRENALAEMKRAIAASDSRDIFLAAMQIGAASDLISHNSVDSTMRLIQEVTPKLKAPYRSLMELAQATLLCRQYSSYSYEINRRELPAQPVPESIAEWGRVHFRDSVLALVGKAYRSEGNSKMPITEIKGVLEDSQQAADRGMTVGEFVTMQGIQILSRFTSADNTNRSAEVIPFFADEKNEDRDPLTSLYAEMKTRLEGAVAEASSSWLAAGIAEWLSGYIPADRQGAFIATQISRIGMKPGLSTLLRKAYSYNSKDDEGALTHKEVYDLAREYAEKYPRISDIGNARWIIARYEDKGAEINFKGEYVAELPAKFTVRRTNYGKLFVVVSKVKLNDRKKEATLEEIKRGEIVAAIPVEGCDSLGSTDEFTLETPPLATGDYYAYFSTDGTLNGAIQLNSNRSRKYDTFTVTDISMMISDTNETGTKDGKRKSVFVVDSHTQAPVEGATVELFRRYNYNSPLISEAKTVTDKDGRALLPKINGYDSYLVTASKGGSFISLGYYDSGYYQDYDNSETPDFAEILTDLSIYHPGDTVRFATILYIVDDNRRRILPDSEVKITLTDANYEKVDSLTLRTDRYGRASGEFRIPTDRLLGNFTLVASSTDKKRLKNSEGHNIGETDFQVADYKMPTFLVTTEVAEGELKAGDTVKFKGQAMTYSGLPVAGARVDFNVTYSSWWRWWGDSSNASYGSSLSTGPDGKFEIELPTAGLKGTRFEYGLFTLNATVTNGAGETQAAQPLRFSLGESLTVRPAIPAETEVTADTLKLHVPVYNAIDVPVVKEVAYNVLDSNDRKLTEGKFTSPLLEIPSKLLPSGTYRFAFSIPSAPEVETDTVKSIVWRRTDKTVPSETPLWCPVHNVTAADGAKKVKVEFGSYYPRSWIFVTVDSSDGRSYTRWVKADARNTSIEIDAPADNARTNVRLVGMHDLNNKTSVVTVIPAAQAKEMKVEARSFRDRITPCTEEKWSFSFSYDGKQKPGLPALAVMTDKALDAIAPFNWSLPLRGISYSFNTSLNIWNTSYFRYSISDRKEAHMSGYEFTVPSLRTYLEEYSDPSSLFGSVAYAGGIHIRGRRAKNTKSVLEDSDNGPVLNELVTMEAAAPMMSKSVASAKAEATEEAEEEAGTGGASPRTVENYRPSELPIAFFRPSLNADGEGVVTVDFTVPDYNTTWKFQLLGYDDEMNNAVLTLDAIAAKKVIVRSNPPRFLRTGDKTVLSAMLANNSDETIPVGGTLELFNPLTGEVILSTDFKAEDLKPSESRTVSMEWTVPTNVSVVALRAVAASGGFSDGEQTAFPVLPSSSPVTESVPFYLGPKQSQFSVTLPKYDKDANVTLQYCDNPVWYCLTALPAIATPDSQNALSLLSALYANTVASGLVGKYPRLREAVAFLTSPAAQAIGDSTLVSPLERNKKLKITALNATPWVNSAQSETLRMGHLSELLDATHCSVAVTSLTDKITALQNSDGGWSWLPEMKSSGYITARVLLYYAMMQGNGYVEFTPEMRRMVENGIRYMDNEIVKSYRKYPKDFRPESMMNYLYVRSYFDFVGDGESTFAGLARRCVTDVEKGWKSYEIYDKATAAMLLYRKGHKENASTILKSLKELASIDPAKGSWFDNLGSAFHGFNKLITTTQVLEAFAEIAPKDPMVDGLRQWLILSRQTEDWGANSRYLAEVVNTILTTGSEWTVNGNPAKFRLGDKEIEPSQRALLTGEFTMELSPEEASGQTLSVDRDGASQAWGGVVSQYVAPIAEIRSNSVPDLRIEKSVYSITHAEDGATASADGFRKGDKVRVTLTVTSGRDMQYVALTDERAACLEPVDQTSGYASTDGVFYYRETRDTQTNLFIPFLPKGTFVITYDCYADRDGDYALGIATIQSLYAPTLVSHSAGSAVEVTD